jgi:MFS family permease
VVNKTFMTSVLDMADRLTCARPRGTLAENNNRSARINATADSDDIACFGVVQRGSRVEWMNDEARGDEAASGSASAGGVSPGAEPRGGFGALLRIRDFRLLWLGQVISQTGDYFAYLALMVVVGGFSSDNGEMAVSLSGLMMVVVLPRLLFGALAGVFVDRWPRRRTMLAADLARVVLTLALIPAFQSKNLPVVYALVFTASVVSTFFTAAKVALVPQLVPEAQLLSANAMSQISFMVANFAGPALAGSVFALIGDDRKWLAFVANAASFLASGVALWLMSPAGDARADRAPSPARAGALRRIYDELLVGLKVLALNRAISSLAIVCAIALFGAGALNMMWIVLLNARFGFEGNELAWRCSIVDMAFCAGMVLASAGIGVALSGVAPKWLIVWGMLISGGLTALVGQMPVYWGVVAATALLSLFVAPVHAGISTLVQLVVPNDQLGRVGGGVSMVSEAAMMCSLGLVGVVVKTLGAPTTYLVAGMLCVVGGATAWARLPAVKAQAARPPSPSLSPE